MIVRTICGAMGTAALVLAGAQPVSANDDHHHHHNDEVKVLVCVKFDDHHHGHDDGDNHGHDDGGSYRHDDGDNGDEHGNDEVKVKVRTDEDSDWAQIGDRECAKFELRFDDNWVKVKAWPEDPKDEVEFKTFGHDVEDFWTHDNRIKIQFDDEEDSPFVGVLIKVDEDHHHGDDSHDD